MIPCARQRPFAASSPTDVNGPARNGSVFAAASRGRSSWSGLLRISLVAVPVKAYPAVSSTSISPHFHLLHAGCGQRVVGRGRDFFRAVVAQLKANPQYTSEAERVRAFIAKGAGSRSTYFNVAKRLPPPTSVPHLPLKNRPPASRAADEKIAGILRRWRGHLGDN